jgi:hypothetical protein
MKNKISIAYFFMAMQCAGIIIAAILLYYKIKGCA